MSRLFSRAYLPSRERVEVPEGKTNRAVCSRICEGWGLEARIEGCNLLFLFSRVKSSSFSP